MASSMLCNRPSMLASRQATVMKRPATLMQTRPMVPRSSVVAHGKAVKINAEQLEVEIQNRDRTLIVDFFATWCGPCLLLAQELEKVAEKLGDDVRVLKVDVDENPQLSSDLRIEGLPTIVFIPKDAGRPALRTEGLLPAEQICDIVKEMSAPQAPPA